ncbi:MAG: division/cell wall cluster transcriptional repressor MraZ [Acidobacteria bacterium]|nr:division/cell wall cluster transcriptional repressor MraZ [Acidobacteriota bacterium]MCI0720123.1 division/cell wall cluster transcriptional repressor MraZ [Acidobacteriota bacterium]
MLRGSYAAKVDEKGRLKLPSDFRSKIEEEYGSKFYITASLEIDSVHLYPLPVWEEIERKLAGQPMTNASVDKFMDITGYYGAEVTMDSQGRILIPQRLREAVQIRDEVNVMGKMRFLSIWNDENYKTKRLNQPFGKDDAHELSQRGI